MISTITFEHGEKTCAIKSGVFCRWQGAMGFGTKPVCVLFSNEPLYEKDGWIQRCAQCINVFEVTTDAPPRE